MPVTASNEKKLGLGTSKLFKVIHHSIDGYEGLIGQIACGE
jgi:hypothetical protein